MKAIVYDLRTNSLFSIRVPYTWQSALSYPLPPPSSIIGMLANALQRYKNNKHPIEYLAEVEQNIKWAGARLLSPAVVKSYTTSAITKWEITIGGKSTNALGREYVFSKNIRVVAIIQNEAFANDLINALKNAPITCGDSESLVSIEELQTPRNVVECQFGPGEAVETEYPIPMKFEELEVTNGIGKLYLQHERCKKVGNKFPLVSYIYPIQEEGGILHPSRFQIRIKKQVKGYEIVGIGKVIAVT